MEKNNKIVVALLLFIGFLIVFLGGVLAGTKLEAILQERAATELELALQEVKEEVVLEEKEEASEVIQPEEEKEVVPEESVSENQVEQGEETVSENQVANMYKPIWKEGYSSGEPFMTINQRMAVQSSYDETNMVNAIDQSIIENSTLDFSNMKITCLGDSITQGAGDTTPYPVYLQEILGAEVINAGVGGSTVARNNGTFAMVDRVEQIDPDTDLLIVLGGINDNFYQAFWEFGLIYGEAKGEGSFCGDVQLLSRRCGWHFPDMKVIFFTPTANLQVTEMREDDDSLLPQEDYIEAYRVIAAEEGMQLVNLYDMNFLNSHDPLVRESYMRDYTHFNTDGNKILAERIASEIIARYEE